MAQVEDQSASGTGGLADTLAAYRTGEEISENDAMALAKAERNASQFDREQLVRMAEASADEIQAELFGG